MQTQGTAKRGRSPKTDDDPAAPLSIPAHEAFAKLLLTGCSQSDAYRKVYPKSRKWKDSAVHGKASELAGKVSGRIVHLKGMAASAAVGDLQARRELLWQTIQECRKGLTPYVQSLPDGDMIFDLNRDNLTFAIESVEQRLETSGVGDGAKDATIRKIKVRDYLSYLQELNKLDKLYVEKHEHTGPDGKPLAPFVIVYDRAEQKAL